MSKGLHTGDLFTVPIDAERMALGQLAEKVHAAWFVLVFEGSYAAGTRIDLEVARAARIQLQALTFHARIASGAWEVVGNAGVDKPRIRWPEFRVMTGVEPTSHVVTNYRGDPIREATWRDRNLPTMTFVSPMILERAIKAIHRATPWRPDFDKLLAPGARRP